jgi:predicted DNA-binding transcriptional regulator YafY
MAMSFSKLFALLDLLQSHAIVSAATLTERLEVDGRSLRRMIVQLQRMGIPVESRRGRYGGYRLRPGATLPPLMLKDDEALSVTLGLLVTQRMGLSAAEGTLVKLRRVVPARIQEYVYALQAAITFDLPQTWIASSLTTLLTLGLATYRNQQVHLWYTDHAGNRSDRPFDCYGILYYQGAWYAIGWCGLRQAMRVLRMERISAVQLSATTFAPPPNFDALTFALHHFAAIPDTWHIQVWLDDALEHLRSLVPPAFATLAEEGHGVLLQAYDRDLAHTARFLINLGCPFRVIDPPELRVALRELADAILRYAHDGA